MAAAIVGSRGACAAKGIGVTAGVPVRKARDSSVGRDSTHRNFTGLCPCNCNCGHHKFLRLVVVNDMRVCMIRRDGGVAAGRLLHQVCTNLRCGNRQRTGGEIPLKLPRCFIEDFEFLRRVHRDAPHGFTRRYWRKNDSMLEVERRLPFHIIGMPRHEADFAGHAYEQGMRRMDRLTMHPRFTHRGSLHGKH